MYVPPGRHCTLLLVVRRLLRAAGAQAPRRLPHGGPAAENKAQNKARNQPRGSRRRVYAQNS